MRVTTFESAGNAVALGGNIRLLSTMTGTGIPPVSVQWFEGAGDGASYQSMRVLPRVIDLPLAIYGVNREEVWANYSAVAVVFDNSRGDATRIRMQLGGEFWYTDVVRTGGGDFSWSQDTDGVTFIKTVVTVKAGDPYWTREDATSQVVSPGGLGRGLIKTPNPRLHALKVSTTNSLGSVLFENPGDVGIYPSWTVNGPFTGFTLTSPAGEELTWTGNILAGQHITIDSESGTVVDQAGVNRYSGLAASPKFWKVPPGESVGTVEVLDTATTSSVVALWRPKKWVMF